MVRFSDMLGGDGEPDDARAVTAERDLPPIVDDDAPDADAPPAEEPPVAEVVPEPEPAPDGLSAQDVLDRLTKYASATRAQPSAPPQPEATAAPDPEPAPAPVPDEQAFARSNTDDAGDDILPRAKRSLRNPRGKRG